MADVFASYTHPDKARAEQIAQALIQAGKSVWWDGRLGPGASLRDAIEEELERAKCVIVVWPRDSVRSDWLRNEVSAGHDRGVLLPVLTEGPAKLPLPFGHLQALDLSTWTGDLEAPEFLALLENVNRILDRTLLRRATKATSFPQRAQQSDIHESAKNPTTTLESQIRSEPARSIFLCYRREDTQDAAGRLHDRLTATFGSDRVFMDIDSVPFGVDFVEHVTEQIATCSAVIVMIGKQWLKIRDRQRRRRLDNEDDLVRAEIRAALQQKIRVIPVVVQGASMPAAEDLPNDVSLLARRNGIELRPDQWNDGVERLLRELEPVIGKQHVIAQAKPKPVDRRRLRFTVHRAAFLNDGREAYFLNATNLSKDRDIEITHVWLDSTPPIPAAQPNRPLPKRLKPDETWETWIYLDQGPPPLRESVVELARARLSTGKQVKAKANVGVPPIGQVPDP